MARRKKGRVVNGVLFVDKPSGPSSNQVLQQIRWLYQAQKAGHGGTLDPFAEGALPLLFGEATKFGRFFLHGDKTYRVKLRFGTQTDSDDIQGVVIRQAPIPDFDNIDWTQAFAPFVGEILQHPPIYSALKVGGERAYALARQGKLPNLAPRSVRIDRLHLLALDAAQGEMVLEVVCGKGTYIRALVRDLGLALGSCAHAVALRRLRLGKWRLPLHSPSALAEIEQAARDQLLLPVETCVAGLPRAQIAPEKLAFIRHGNDITCASADGEYALYDGDKFFGVGESRGGRLYPLRLCQIGES